MRCRKIFLCVVLILFAATISGCKGLGKAVVRGAKDVAVDVAVDYAVDAVTGNNQPNNNRPSNNRPPAQTPVSKPSRLAGAGALVTGGAVVANEILSEDKHWIKDINNGAHVWNPEPQEGESISWDGGVVRDGNNLYAQGSGTLTWYKNGQVIQVDEGTFERGRHHGRFKHTFKSGNVDYSNWNHGEEIPLNAPANIAEESLSKDPHWIKDINNGAHVWNPEPQDGESIRWDGGIVRDGDNLYAQGSGMLTWYKNGQVIQVDEGTFERGRHHGRFKHTFKSGNVDYSNWNHGEEIP